MKSLQREQVEYVYFSGMENMLERPLDPLLLGQMVMESKEMAAKCTSPRTGEKEQLPRYVSFL